jgi:shikimate dehydrogenase
LILSDFTVIVNASPVGTFPNVDTCPAIPYQFLTNKHLLYDVVYNPAETLFLKKGREQGAVGLNGEQMLVEQALAAWEIWNK